MKNAPEITGPAVVCRGGVHGVDEVGGGLPTSARVYAARALRAPCTAGVHVDVRVGLLDGALTLPGHQCPALGLLKRKNVIEDMLVASTVRVSGLWGQQTC